MKKKMPKQNEIVICRITKIYPHSAFAHLEEYNREGLIHISEVASGWVKDINRHLKEGQKVVAKVVWVEDNKINLSLKKVDKKQKKSKLNEYKKETKAEKMIEIAAKKMKQSSKTDDVKEKAREHFGSVSACFEAVLKNPELLKGVFTDKWIETIKEIAEKNVKEREFEFRAKISISSSEPGGVDKIKKVLEKGEKSGLKVNYLSAPDYSLSFVSDDAKKGEHEFEKKLEELEKTAKKEGGFSKIKIIKT